MPVSDLDIVRSAHLYIQLHGDEAIAKAREMVEAMRAKGDVDRRDYRAGHVVDGRPH